MAARCCLILIVCVKISAGYRLMDNKPLESLTWPSEYHLKAEKIDLKSGIKEPMELWYSDYLNRSRIDFYGGSVKKYYAWNPEPDSAVVGNVFPVSTEDVKNRMVCMETTKGANLYELLPKPEKYVYVGEKEHEGRWVDIWEYNHVFKEQAWKEETLYTIRDADCNVPMQMVVKTYFPAKSALLGHTIFNYFSYNSTVDEDALDSSNDKCDLTVTLGEDFHKDVQHLHPIKETDVDFGFHSYKKHHNKNYETKDEHEIRKAIFQKNWEMINHHNRQNLGYRLELNYFADLTADEVSEVTGLLPSRAPPTHAFPHSDDEVRTLAEELPDNYDMRVEGVISAVKNQAQCGSCWAFSATAAVEGALARSNGGRIMDLSEQSMVDCSWGFHNAGCDGGDMSMAFMYILKHGIPLEEEYGPYLEKDGFCHTENMTTMYKIRGFTAVTRHNPEAMKVALHNFGPVAVSISFNDKMRFYASGIFYDPDCNDGPINHGVTAVGYGVRDGVNYWIIKNSYGPDWGEDGYLLISATNNNCFVLEDAVYPVV